MAKRFSKYVGEKKKKKRFAGPGGMRSGKAWWSWKVGVTTYVGKLQMSNQRQEIFQNAIESELRVQDRASEKNAGSNH